MLMIEIGVSSQKNLLDLLVKELNIRVPLPNYIEKEEIIYKNDPWLSVNELFIKTNKYEKVLYSKIVRQDFVQIILINHIGSVLFQLRFRIGAMDYVLELPGGGCEDGEKPKDSAYRELKEELGIKINNLSPLGSYFLDPMRSSCKGHFFYGKEEESIRELSGTIPGELEDSTFFWLPNSLIKRFQPMMPMSTVSALSSLIN